MSTTLKERLNASTVRQIAEMFQGAWPAFPTGSFVSQAREGLGTKELKARGYHIAAALRAALPPSYQRGAEIFCEALGPPLGSSRSPGESLFLYLPWMLYIERYGLEEREVSMTMQYELTKRSTAEFSMRPFLERWPRPTLEILHQWVHDPNEHVRRLVSEATRPRLPWARRLRCFEEDPTPVLLLLEQLKDDPSLYVRRSVANHLNDLSKEHSPRVVALMRQWSEKASPARTQLINHALRTLLKKGDPDTLELLGYGEVEHLAPTARQVSPRRVERGQSIRLEVEVTNVDQSPRPVLVDFIIHYQGAQGQRRPKVFKGKRLLLPPHGKEVIRKTVALREMTTRKHYNGEHLVEVVLNGSPHVLGTFLLQGA